jgi:hypothetical protein
MKYYLDLAVLFICCFSLSVFGQTVKLTGTIFDPNGALVINGQISAVDGKGRTISAQTNSEGQFNLDLAPGIYSLDIAAPGFLTIKHKEFLVVNTTTGRMSSDFVLFAGKYHEPCGYSGADCLPAKSLIRSCEVRYSPKLREILEEFTDSKASEKPM